MRLPQPLADGEDLGPITWCDNPNTELIRSMLVKHGYDTTSLQMKSLTQYTLNQPMHDAPCVCKSQAISITDGDIFQRCCSFRVLGTIPTEEVIYDVKPNQQHLRYRRQRARPIRTPESYKYIGLKSATGTGKNRQLDVLVRALLYGEFNK